jgi:hypothetical protein
MAPPVGDYDYGVRCDGSLRVECLLGNEILFDCSKIGLGCVPVVVSTQTAPPQQVQVARCQAGNECEPSSTPASCDGTKLTFCNNGLRATIDCAALGFAGCGADQGGHCTR